MNSADQENIEDNKGSEIAEIQQLKEEEYYKVESTRKILDQVCTASNETEDPEVIVTSCEPQLVVQMFEENHDTVRCGVHSKITRPEV